MRIHCKPENAMRTFNWRAADERYHCSNPSCEYEVTIHTVAMMYSVDDISRQTVSEILLPPGRMKRTRR